MKMFKWQKKYSALFLTMRTTHQFAEDAFNAILVNLKKDQLNIIFSHSA